MPLSSKFLTESTSKKIVKIGQYLAKIWTKYDSLVFLGHPVYVNLCLTQSCLKTRAPTLKIPPRKQYVVQNGSSRSFGHLFDVDEKQFGDYTY